MRTAIAILALLACVGVVDASALDGRVTVSATILDVRTVDVGPPIASAGDGRSEVLRLWNRTVSDVPIGHGLMRCTLMGRGGAYGSGVSYCTGTFALGSGSKRGKIAVTGPRRHPKKADLVVTGGTGIYAGSGGSLHIRPGSVPGTLLLRFNLVS